MLGILVGLIGGALIVLTGLGGGFIMVPLLVLLYGMSQHAAQGTSLAVLLPPLGLLAFLQYYRHGNVGAYVAHLISGPMLRKGFAVVLALIALDMFFRE